MPKQVMTPPRLLDLALVPVVFVAALCLCLAYPIGAAGCWWWGEEPTP